MKQLLAIPDQLTPLLQAARKSAGLNQTILAKRLGLGQSRMSALELDPAAMRLDQLLAICSALQLELVVQTKPPLNQSAAASPVQEW